MILRHVNPHTRTINVAIVKRGYDSSLKIEIKLTT